jgi:hypothetical protein
VKVRLTIDRIVLDELELSPNERVRFDEAFRHSLRSFLFQRTSMSEQGELTGRRSRHERIDMRRDNRMSGIDFGTAVGMAVGEQLLPTHSDSGRKQ